MSSGRFASNWYRALFSNPLITWRPIHTHTFHVGSQVTIIPSHHAHGSKDGVVMQHTKKFVVIAVNWNKARILPKLLDEVMLCKGRLDCCNILGNPTAWHRCVELS